MKTIVCFGEVMTRLSSPGFSRLQQSMPGSLEASFAGAEANIAASIALLGGKSRYVTALPKNIIAESCVNFLRGMGVDTRGIYHSGFGRMPTYYIEGGAAQRPANVLYDREHSSFSLTSGGDYAWDEIFTDASWLVISGISPSLSATAAEATLQAATEARSRGVTVCCDLNFRAKLWRWEHGTPARDLARRVMGELMPLVDVVLTNPDQAYDVLGIPWAGADSRDFEAYGQAARRISEAHPHLKKIVFTLRESLSASHNNIGAIMLDPATDCVVVAPLEDGVYAPYEINPIVDRIGGGDAFAAGWIFALHTAGLDDPLTALSFGVAASCLAHSVPGDINFASRAEVESLMRGNRSGRILR